MRLVPHYLSICKRYRNHYPLKELKSAALAEKRVMVMENVLKGTHRHLKSRVIEMGDTRHSPISTSALIIYD